MDSPQKTYADYIATCPRAERLGIHGLFTDEGEPVILSRVSKELNEYKAISTQQYFSKNIQLLLA